MNGLCSIAPVWPLHYIALHCISFSCSPSFVWCARERERERERERTEQSHYARVHPSVLGLSSYPFCLLPWSWRRLCRARTTAVSVYIKRRLGWLGWLSRASSKGGSWAKSARRCFTRATTNDARRGAFHLLALTLSFERLIVVVAGFTAVVRRHASFFGVEDPPRLGADLKSNRDVSYAPRLPRVPIAIVHSPPYDLWGFFLNSPWLLALVRTRHFRSLCFFLSCIFVLFLCFPSFAQVRFHRSLYSILFLFFSFRRDISESNFTSLCRSPCRSLLFSQILLNWTELNQRSFPFIKLIDCISFSRVCVIFVCNVAVAHIHVRIIMRFDSGFNDESRSGWYNNS